MSSPGPENNHQPVVIGRSDHPISRSMLNEPALKVLYRLKNSGHQAFLVGGAVRDLLLGIVPKDFDVATDATPDEVHELFRNSRLIGRRFKIVHVRFGREIIEVATFRGDTSSLEEDDRTRDNTGRILRDNVYGDIDDDVWRRDFTVNALYYNIADFSVWDYVGGVADVRDKTLKLIGDPVTRYKEDPVRMLRAVRFAAKLGFSIDEASEEPLYELGHLLDNVPPARLADEAVKLFLAGHAAATFELLHKYDLFKVMYAQTEDFLDKSEDDDEVERAFALFRAATRNTDQRIAEGKPVTPAFLIAVFLWPVVKEATDYYRQEGKGPVQSIIMGCEHVMQEQQKSMSVPRRVVLPVKEMLTMQVRLHHRRGVRALRMLDHPRFRAAYDLLLLRTQVGEEPKELADWWTEIQTASHQEQRDMVGMGKSKASGAPAGGKKKPRRRRPRRKKAAD
ncbi:MAG: polynucleotide adenylyltransferase PcnB [Gammaproteobacteria bacterium]